MKTDAERKIFTFFDGTRNVRRDPSVVMRKIMRAGEGVTIDDLLAKVFTEQDSGSVEAALEKATAMETLCKIAREVLDIKPFGDPDGGLTEWESVEVFDKFLAFAAEMKAPATSEVSPEVDAPEPSNAGPVAPESSRLRARGEPFRVPPILQGIVQQLTADES